MDKYPNIDQVLHKIYLENKVELESQLQAIRDQAAAFKNPKGISDFGQKVASIPPIIYDKLSLIYGVKAWQDPEFVLWVLNKAPRLKYIPSVRWTTNRF